MAENVMVLTGSNFDADVKQSNVPVLIDFWAPWCAPCKAVAPIIEELASDYEGRIKMGKLNIDEGDAREIAGQYGIQSIPTLVIVHGGKEVSRLGGARPKEKIVEWIDSNL